MNHFEKVFQCFPQEIQRQIGAMDRAARETMEEVRVYRGREVRIISRGRVTALSGRIDGGDITNILNNLLKFSYYAYEEDLARGFVTIDGGHRVGICGKAVMEKGKVTLLREISSLNIRCGHEIIGCSDPLRSLLTDQKGRPSSLLIASPPGCGKTTLLRDIARTLGEDFGCKVAICDERSEIAGMHGGLSGCRLGPMTDVLDGCPKAEGILMLIRAMSPDVIITDEIGRPEDGEAIKACRNSGVSVIASVHGSDMEDLGRLPLMRELDISSGGIFDHIIFLTSRPAPGTVREVLHG